MMKIIEPGYEILTEISPGGEDELKAIELAGRTCYKSEDKITSGSARRFVAMLVKHEHEAMLEHSVLSVKFIIDRGVSHEFVRHRMCGFAQESTRYCNYSKGKFGEEITVIDPHPFIERGTIEWDNWEQLCLWTETSYNNLIRRGVQPQMARSVLPNSLKTELVITANYREWRHILKLRAAEDAHPQIRQVCIPLLEELKRLIPVIFDDISY